MRVKNKFMKKAVFVLVAVLVVGGLVFGVSSNRAGVPVKSKGDSISVDGVLSKDVYTFVCEIPKQQKPELIYFACGDGNTGVGKIKWDIWEATGASGTGEYFANDCDPDCADGKFNFTNVKVSIDKPIGVDGKVHLTHLTYESIKPGVLNGEWDLAEFYLMMEKNK